MKVTVTVIGNSALYGFIPAGGVRSSHYLRPMQAQPEIQAIILDLGGVVLDIDYNRAVQAFSALGFEDFDQHYSQLKQDGLFDRLETGRIDPAEFRSVIRRRIPHVSDTDIDNAWNALILDFPEGRLEFIRSLNKRLPVFLLSNTNVIHLNFFNRLLQEKTGSQGLNDYFTKVYLSHEIGQRKPDPDAFLAIIREQGLNPATTLFVDDSPQHVEAARALGLQTLHLRNIGNLERELGPFLAQLDQYSRG